MTMTATTIFDFLSSNTISSSLCLFKHIYYFTLFVLCSQMIYVFFDWHHHIRKFIWEEGTEIKILIPPSMFLLIGLKPKTVRFPRLSRIRRCGQIHEERPGRDQSSIPNSSLTLFRSSLSTSKSHSSSSNPSRSSMPPSPS